LVIDDEPLIGGIIRRALSGDHEISVVQRAADALTLSSAARNSISCCVTS
jgi:hypothetical protein